MEAVSGALREDRGVVDCLCAVHPAFLIGAGVIILLGGAVLPALPIAASAPFLIELASIVLEFAGSMIFFIGLMKAFLCSDGDSSGAERILPERVVYDRSQEGVESRTSSNRESDSVGEAYAGMVSARAEMEAAQRELARVRREGAAEVQRALAECAASEQRRDAEGAAHTEMLQRASAQARAEHEVAMAALDVERNALRESGAQGLAALMAQHAELTTRREQAQLHLNAVQAERARLLAQPSA